jgi:hypothetical protein
VHGARLVLLLAFNGNSAVGLIVLASAVIPPIVAIVVCRIAWVWAKSNDGVERVDFAVLLRRALWLPERRREAGE